jgi:hypothetical protein
METLQYSQDGLNFDIVSGAGKTLTKDQPVPETGVGIVVTPSGHRIVMFPHYKERGSVAVGAGLILELRSVVTSVRGNCADAATIEASFEDDDDDFEDDDEDLDDDLDADEVDDEVDDEKEDV